SWRFSSQLSLPPFSLRASLPRPSWQEPTSPPARLSSLPVLLSPTARRVWREVRLFWRRARLSQRPAQLSLPRHWSLRLRRQPQRSRPEPRLRAGRARDTPRDTHPAHT